MGIVLWIIFGALAGWIASIIMKTDAQQGAFANIIVGVVGSVIGGYLMGLVGGEGVTGLDIRSLIVAVLGSVVLIYIVSIFRRST